MTSMINSTIIGKSGAGDMHAMKTSTAISVGRKEGFIFNNMKIHDFDSGLFMSVCSGCDPLNLMHMSKGGHVTHL